MMTQSSPDITIKALFAHFDRLDWAAAVALIDPQVRFRTGGRDLDRDAWLGMAKMFSTAFADSAHDVQSCVVQGDTVAARGVWRGTHRGDFYGVPATGRTVAIDFVSVERVVDGQVVEHHAQFDAMSLMQQIGAMPG